MVRRWPQLPQGHNCDVGRATAGRNQRLRSQQSYALHQLRPIVLHIADLGADFPRLDLSAVRLHHLPVRRLCRSPARRPVRVYRGDVRSGIQRGRRDLRAGVVLRCPVPRGRAASQPDAAPAQREPPVWVGGSAGEPEWISQQVVAGRTDRVAELHRSGLLNGNLRPSSR
jgi:hypothetical protein